MPSFLLFSIFPIAWLFSFFTLTAVDIKVLVVRISLIGTHCLWFIARLHERKFEVPAPSVMIPISLCGFWIVLTTLVNPYANIYGFIDQLLFLSLLLFFPQIVSSERQIHLLLRFWIAACIPVCLYYGVQKLGVDPLTWGNQEYNPVGSTFGNRNYLVFYLLTTFPFSVYLLKKRSDLDRYLGGIAAICIFACIAMSDSRAGQGILLVLIPMLLLWFMHSSTFNKIQRAVRILCFSILGTFLIVFLIAIPFVLSQSPGTILEWTHGRYFLWVSSFKIIAQNPFLGHGISSFPVLISIYRDQNLGEAFGVMDMAGNAHNIFLELLVEVGFIGLSIFLLSFLWLIIQPFRYRKEFNRKLAPIQTIALISFVGIFLFSLVGEIANVTFCTFFSWLTLSLYCWHCYDRNRVRVISLPHVKFALPAGSILIALSFMVFCVEQGSVFYSNALTTHALKTIPQSEPKKSIPILNKATRLDSNNTQALYMLSWAYLIDNQPTESEKVSDLVIKRNPFYSDIRFEKGIHAIQKREYRLAIRELKHAVRIYPREYEPALLLAKALYLSKEYQECKETCELLYRYGHRTKEVQRLYQAAKNSMESQRVLKNLPSK